MDYLDSRVRFQIEADLNRRYRKMIDGIRDAIFVETFTGKIIDVNQSACVLYGYSREEFLQMSVSDLVPPGYVRVLPPQQDNRDQFSQTIETVNIRKNREIFPVEVNVQVMEIEGERLLMVMARDISEKKRAESLQQATLQISQAANMTVSLEEYIDQVHLVLSLLIPSRNLYVALYDQGSDNLSFIYFVDEKYSRFQVDENDLETELIRKVIQSQQPLLATSDTLVSIATERQTEPASFSQELFNWLGVPLQTTTLNTIGILAVKSYTSEIIFTEQDLNLLVFVSSQIALTVERRRVEAQIAKSEDRYRSLVRNVPIALCRTGPEPEGALRMANPAFMDLFGILTELDVFRLKMPDLFNQPTDWYNFYHDLLAIGAVTGKVQRFQTRTGALLWGLITASVIRSENGEIESLDLTIQDITQRIRREREREAQLLVSASLIQVQDTIHLLQAVLNAIMRAVPAVEAGSITMLDRSDASLVIKAAIGYSDSEVVGLRFEQKNCLIAQVINDKKSICVHSFETGVDLLYPFELAEFKNPQSALVTPLISQRRILGAISLENYKFNHAFNEDDRDLLLTFSASVSAAIESITLFEESKRKVKELSVLTLVSTALRGARSSSEVFSVLIEPFVTSTGADGVLLALRNQFTGDILIERAHGIWGELAGRYLSPGQGLIGSAINSPRTITWEENYDDALFTQFVFPGNIKSLVCVPLISQEQVLGVLCMGRKETAHEGDVNLMEAIGDMVANVFHRLNLIEQTERRLQHLQALHSIDRAIASSLDLRLTLNILLEQVTLELRVDAAQVFLLTPYLHLDLAAGRGFRTLHPVLKEIKPGEGPAGRAVIDRRTIKLATSEELRQHPLYDALLVDEKFTCCVAEPLIAKGQVIGVLEIFQRAPLNPDSEWQEFLVSLAGQAAIAVDNAQLLDKLQRSNIELASAYDATIEGWSRALDLRDKETEGHTQRVTLWTEYLAREMKVPEEEILHIRRGALLHDIGKMGIPDNILLKPGPLTDEEWEIMRKHPEYANQLLSPIHFLRPALAIPYSHHERWDGNGYPYGLRGERIPLPARIFTLVDVWDAVTSDRPYRRAWSPAKALEYIESQSGKWFDPEITLVFLRMIRGC